MCQDIKLGDPKPWEMPSGRSPGASFRLAPQGWVHLFNSLINLLELFQRN